MSRVLQGVIAGIGFLGAGTILKNKEGDEGHVKGLTTAAGLWMTAAIGVAAGLGKEATALLSTLLALGIFSVMPRIVRLFEKDEQKNDLL
jgi:putative Mg2+ transporter-C (MgtC) family protein